MKKTRVKAVSEAQKAENLKRQKLRKKLILEGPHDAAGFPLCVRCHSRGRGLPLELSHKKALSDHGKTTEKNCEILCSACHHGEGGHRDEMKREDIAVDRPVSLAGYTHGLRSFSKKEQLHSKL